jgi:hypothetical protein
VGADRENKVAVSLLVTSNAKVPLGIVLSGLAASQAILAGIQTARTKVAPRRGKRLLASGRRKPAGSSPVC